MPASGQLKVALPAPLAKTKLATVARGGLAVSPSPSGSDWSKRTLSGGASRPKFSTAALGAQLLSACTVTLKGLPAATNLAPVASIAPGLFWAAKLKVAGRTISLAAPVTVVAAWSRTFRLNWPTSWYFRRTRAVELLSKPKATEVWLAVDKLTLLAQPSLLSCSTAGLAEAAGLTLA